MRGNFRALVYHTSLHGVGLQLRYLVLFNDNFTPRYSLNFCTARPQSTGIIPTYDGKSLSELLIWSRIEL